ncbi:hypothetical protein N9W41_00635 [bacterium]|nr:hypothetical protein [bacterium]
MKEHKVDYTLFLILTAVVSVLGLVTAGEIIYSSSKIVAAESSSRLPQSVAGVAGSSDSEIKRSLYKVVKINCDAGSKQSKELAFDTKYISLESGWCVRGQVKKLSVKNLTNKLDGVGYVLDKHKIKTDYIFLSPGKNDFEIKFLNRDKEYVHNISIHRKKM